VIPVVVIGAVNVDAVMSVQSIPRPGETVMATSLRLSGGGKGGNQACAAAALGAQTALIASVGDDEAGRLARAALEQAGVDTDAVLDSDAPTGSATVMVAADGENAIVVAPGANDRLSAADVEKVLSRYPEAVVLVSLEVPMEAVLAAAAAATRQGLTLVVNPAPALELPSQLLAASDLLIPNEHEVGGLGPPDVAGLLAAGVGAVAVTRGAAGVDLVRTGLPVVHQPAIPVDVVDTTGAGDAFCGGVVWALSRGADLEMAVKMGAATGALATRAVGARASLPSVEEVTGLVPRAPRPSRLDQEDAGPVGS